MAKKEYFFIIASLFSILLLLNTVSAGPVEDINVFIDGLVDVLEPVAKLLVGDIEGTSTFSRTDVLLAKTLILILIFSVVFLIFGRTSLFGSNSLILFIVSLVVSLLATRWIGNADTIQSIILPYSTLGITLSAALPFIAWFLIVNVGMQNSVPAIRRLAWIFFGIVFVFLLASRYEDLGNASWIYLAITLAAAAMAGIDGTIQRYWARLELERIGKDSADEAITKLERDITQIDKDLADGLYPNPIKAEIKKKKIKRKISQLSRYA